MSSTITLNDGQITVKIGDVEQHCDLVELKLACEEIEERYHAYNEHWRATPEFCRDLAGEFERLGLKCSSTAAFELWGRISDLWDDFKKKRDDSPASDSGTA